MVWPFGSKTRRELYTITRGSESFLYTSGDKDITIGENTWTQLAIKRENIESSSDLEKNNLDVTFAIDSDYAQSCLRSALEEISFLTLSKYQNGIVTLLWQGRLTAVKPKDSTIVLTFENDYTSLARVGARYKYQRTCANDLYGAGCKLDKEQWKVQTTLASVSGTSLVFRDLDSYVDSYFRLGMFQDSNGVFVGIEASSGNTITAIRRLDSLSSQITSDADVLALSSALVALESAQTAYDLALSLLNSLDTSSTTYDDDFTEAQANVSVKLDELNSAQNSYNVALSNIKYFYVYAGCMKSITACDVFGNTDNFMGFPFIPEDNPTTTRIV